MIFFVDFTPFQLAVAGQPGSPNELPGKTAWTESHAGRIQTFDWRKVDSGWRPDNPGSR